jgi:hypothetical protein
MTVEKTGQPETYSYFREAAMRADVYKFSKGLAEYTHKNKVKNIIFADRAVRPAWIAVDEYWNQNFKNDPKPGFYFVNPDGFNVHFVNAPEIQKDRALRLQVKFSQIPILGLGRDSKEATIQKVAERFDTVFTGLRHEKHSPLVLFDACSHEGVTIRDILAALDTAGFKDVRVITASTPDPGSGIRTATKLDTHAHRRDLISCYPFGIDETVKKGTDVLSKATKDKNALETGTLIRKELRQIVRKKGR